MVTVPENVRLSEDGNSVVIIDQTLLPNEKKYIELHTEEEMYGAIKSLKVRGAPAIGICAAYCVYVLSKQADLSSFDAFYKEFSRFSAYLDSSRPTAVNLSAALRRMEKVVLSFKGPSFSSSALLDALYKESRAIQDEDIDMCKKISEYGLSLMKKGDTVLTHCNAGPLATSLYGTGLGTLILGAERGYGFKAYVDETRPLLQGARLTAYELMRAGIDCTLICDNTSPSMTLFTAGEDGMAHEPQIIPVELNSHNAAREFEVFAAAVKGERPLETDAREGAKTVEACLSIIESSVTGKIVHPNYDF